MANKKLPSGGDLTFQKHWTDLGDGVTFAETMTPRLPPGWSVVHQPATNVVATATKAAGAAGVQHVCTAITATLAALATAPAAIQLSVVLRDGLSGAGAIIWAGVISLTAVAGDYKSLVLAGLWLPGSAATALTLEFSAAGGANTIEAVTLVGVDIS